MIENKIVKNGRKRRKKQMEVRNDCLPFFCVAILADTHTAINVYTVINFISTGLKRLKKT